VKAFIEYLVPIQFVGYLRNSNDVLHGIFGRQWQQLLRLRGHHRREREDLRRRAGPYLQAITLDAKVQVDFNPDVEAYYRLIGYENRDVNRISATMPWCRT